MHGFKLVAALGAAMAAALGASSAVARPGADGFTIRSSLDGKKTLPHRIAWIAYPSAAVEAPGVEFLIDGKVAFRNRLEPYAFGADGRDETTGKVRPGYLVTSWLSPGRHAFTVRALRASSAGSRVTATKTVVARVLRAPAPPAALAGTWRRSVPRPVPGDPGALYASGRGGRYADRDPAPAGTWTMVVDRRFVQHVAPTGYVINSDYAAGAQTIRFASPVWTTPRAFLQPDFAHNANPREWGWCDPWGRETMYTWSVEGDTLTLAPSGGADPCKQRGAILAGEWTR
jgi:hypothetical protein